MRTGLLYCMTLYHPALLLLLLLKVAVSGEGYERGADFYLLVPPRIMESKPSTKAATDKGIELKITLVSMSLLCEQMSPSTQKVQDVCPTPQIVIAPLRSRTSKGLLGLVGPITQLALCLWPLSYPLKWSPHLESPERPF